MNGMEFLTIFGAAVGSVSLGFYLVDRSRKNTIEFANHGTISLFNSYCDKINLEILYKDHKINTNVYYFQCKLINNSAVDISKQDLMSPIRLCIHSGKILECVESGNDQVGVSHAVNEEANEVVISWDLFKRKEIIEFALIVEFADSKQRTDLYNDIDLSCRIKNVSKIVKSGGRYDLKSMYQTLLGGVFVFIMVWLYECYKYPIFDKQSATVQVVEQRYVNIADSSEVALQFDLSPQQVERFKCTTDKIADEYLLRENNFKFSQFSYWLYGGATIVLSLGFVFAVWYLLKKIRAIKQ